MSNEKSTERVISQTSIYYTDTHTHTLLLVFEQQTVIN